LLPENRFGVAGKIDNVTRLALALRRGNKIVHQSGFQYQRPAMPRRVVFFSKMCLEYSRRFVGGD
jgi:hypothetical protein